MNKKKYSSSDAEVVATTNLNFQTTKTAKELDARKNRGVRAIQCFKTAKKVLKTVKEKTIILTQ